MILRIAALLAAALLFALPARAWDETGHMVVAYIAWENMTPQARRQAIDLLLSAPEDAGVRQLLPAGPAPLGARHRELFMRAATWADIVRDRDFPERQAKYHRSTWHYVNNYWSGTSPGATDLSRKPALFSAVTRLAQFEHQIRDPYRPEAERAIRLAWVLHLAGDVHQPLHASSRVTPESPGGDAGGNAFCVQYDAERKCRRNLHAYWDNVLDTEYQPARDEQPAAFAARIARGIIQRRPASQFHNELRLGRYAEWAQEGFETAKRSLYPASLIQGQQPGDAYQDAALSTSEEAIARAGYRLAEMLNKAIGR